MAQRSIYISVPIDICLSLEVWGAEQRAWTHFTLILYCGQIRHRAGQNVLSTCVEPDKIYTLKCCLSYNTYKTLFF